jgi:hypothetical protein
MNHRRLLSSVIAILLCCVPSALWAVDLMGEGFGATREEARKNALADLSRRIAAEVQAEQTRREELTGDDFTTNASSQIKVTSHLPLLGVETPVLPDVEGYSASAMMSSEKAVPIYRARLEQLQTKIERAWAELPTLTRNAERIPLLQALWQDMEDYQRHWTVLLVLGGTQDARQLSISEVEVRAQLQQAQTIPDSLEQVAQLLTQGMTERAEVYVFPFLQRGAQEITPFAAALQGRLQSQLSTTRVLDNARFGLHGRYVPTERGVEVSAQLTRLETNEVVTAQALFVPAAAYAGLSTELSQVAFEQQLRDDPERPRLASFRAELKTQKGHEELLFRAGERIELFVKLTKPGYFYVVGHTFASKPPLSYLLELRPELRPPERFLQQVTAAEVNRWIPLGTFEVHPPLGLETLQIIAAKDDLLARLPPYRLDPRTQYYRVGETPSDALARTRALKRLPSQQDADYTAEAALIYTSLPAE